jgi:hypothetical protein
MKNNTAAGRTSSMNYKQIATGEYNCNRAAKSTGFVATPIIDKEK